MTKMDTKDPLVLYGTSFPSRLLLGTARYPSPKVLEHAVSAAQPAMLTVSLRRQAAGHNEIGGQAFWDLLGELKVPFLPNTAGCHSIDEVFTTAMMAREVFGTEWIKLELIGDDYTLQPDTLGLVTAAGTAIVYFVGGNLAVSGTLEVGTVAAFVLYVQQLYQPLAQLTNSRVDVLSAMVSFERVFEVLDRAVKLQLVICPDSHIHTKESMVDRKSVV